MKFAFSTSKNIGFVGTGLMVDYDEFREDPWQLIWLIKDTLFLPMM